MSQGFEVFFFAFMVPQRPIGLKSTKILPLWRILGHAIGDLCLASEATSNSVNLLTKNCLDCCRQCHIFKRPQEFTSLSAQQNHQSTVSVTTATLPSYHGYESA